MAKIGLFYGSNTGNTEYVAYQIKEEIERRAPGSIDVHNIGSSTPEQILQYTHLILGIPTWNVGQLQDDWEAFMPRLATMDFTGRRVAIFGLGDQNGYGFNFLDAVGMLGDALLDRNAELIGFWRVNSYQFNESRAQVDDHFMGLGVDQEGQSDMTGKRLVDWVNQVMYEFEAV
jgi:flavodoxin I